VAQVKKIQKAQVREAWPSFITKSLGQAHFALALKKPTRAPLARPHRRTPTSAAMAAAGDGQTQTQPQQEPEPVAGAATGGGVVAKLEEEWRKAKEHAQTYPYVWSSYILVYGGLGAYLAWRWRKLRRTEDRVRVLQDRLRKLSAAEESQVSAPGSASTASTPPRPQQSASGPGKPASSP